MARQYLSGLRFGTRANDKCVGCTECSRGCRVAIDVMSFELKKDSITHANSSCIGCGICVSVCPTDTLSFGPGASRGHLVRIQGDEISRFPVP